MPWLKQWHNDLDPAFNDRMGDYFADFVQTQARTLALTLDAVRAWTPPLRPKGRKQQSARPDAGLTTQNS